jgi:DNA-directed RNA polymerase subunit RPC12/RpoP
VILVHGLSQAFRWGSRRLPFLCVSGPTTAGKQGMQFRERTMAYVTCPRCEDEFWLDASKEEQGVRCPTCSNKFVFSPPSPLLWWHCRLMRPSSKTPAQTAKDRDMVISVLIAVPAWIVTVFGLLLLGDCIGPSFKSPEWLTGLVVIVCTGVGFGLWGSLFTYLRKRRWHRKHGADTEMPTNYADEP